MVQSGDTDIILRDLLLWTAILVKRYVKLCYVHGRVCPG